MVQTKMGTSANAIDAEADELSFIGDNVAVRQCADIRATGEIANS